MQAIEDGQGKFALAGNCHFQRSQEEQAAASAGTAIADLALYAAKAEGKNHVVYFRHEMLAARDRETQVSDELR